MPIFVIISVGLLAYLYFNGKISKSHILPIIMGLGGLFLLSRGQFAPGAIVSAIAAYGGRSLVSAAFKGVTKEKTVNPAVPDDVIQARALLGVDAHDDEQDIKAKYRKLLETHHPDRGGDEDYARAINLAKDVLIKYQLNNKE